MKRETLLFLIAVSIAACNSAIDSTVQESAIGDNSAVTREYSLDDFHRVPIPEEYAGLVNPVEPDAASLARGKEAFERYCAICHGEIGLGDGLAAANLFPPVPPIAETHSSLSDDFLFFRIRDGGVNEPFNSAMPMWEEILEVNTIWDLINYIRTLESLSVDNEN